LCPLCLGTKLYGTDYIFLAWAFSFLIQIIKSCAWKPQRVKFVVLPPTVAQQHLVCPRWDTHPRVDFQSRYQPIALLHPQASPLAPHVYREISVDYKYYIVTKKQASRGVVQLCTRDAQGYPDGRFVLY